MRVKFKPKIGEHDYLIKQRRTIEFLEEGDKVKVTIWFRGREAQRPELGLRILDRLAEEVAEVGVIEQTPAQEGRNMTMVLGPVRREKPPRASKAEKEAEAEEVSADAEPVAEPAPVAQEAVAQEAVSEAESTEEPATAAVEPTAESEKVEQLPEQAPEAESEMDAAENEEE